jgi:hypothetical protein
MRGSKRGESKEPYKKKMTAFQKAEALAGQRYNRDKLLSMVDELVSHFRFCRGDKYHARSACRHVADALDRCGRSTLQQRWNDFEKRVWPKWVQESIGRVHFGPEARAS